MGAGSKLFYSITKDSAKKHLYLKLVNASSDPQAVELVLTGAKLASTAKLVSLSAPSTQATNSLADPVRIVPVETTLHGVNDHFHHTIPANAIEAIQLDEQ